MKRRLAFALALALAQASILTLALPVSARAETEGNFIRGVDVSSLLSLLRSGVRYYDFDGNVLGGEDGSVDRQGEAFFRFLAENGVNWTRIRVWNDPFDAGGHGYGGGSCDLNAAVRMGRWAAKAGLRTLVDFHCSDFWADPGKQTPPKAWKGKTVDEKAVLLRSYVAESLRTLLAAGVDVGMVQIGNETTSGFCGESDWDNMAKLFSAGSAAVREVSKETGREIPVVLHFTNPEREGSYAYYAQELDRRGVDYDVFASSYYPFWHGSPENLTAVLKQVADTYGKQVLIAETSWGYTSADGDGFPNTSSGDENALHPFTVQGQTDTLSDVARAVTAVGEKGLGLFYWEPAWIPVGDVSGLSGEAREARIAENRRLWEEYGSGWTASFAAGYDANVDGTGGSAVDNQALFDFSGHPLDSLRRFGGASDRPKPDASGKLPWVVPVGIALAAVAVAGFAGRSASKKRRKR